MKDSPRTLFAYFLTLKSDFSVGLFFSFFINILMLVSPIFMLQAYDRVLPSRSELTLLMLLILAMVLLIVMGGLDAIRSQLLSRTAAKLDGLLAKPIYRSVVSMNRMQPSEKSSIYFQDFNILKQFISGGPVTCFFDMPWVPLFILCNFIIHPLLGWITAGGALIILLLAYLNEWKTREPTEKSQKAQANSEKYASDGINNLDTLQSMGMVSSIEQRWYQLHQKSSVLQNTSNILSGAFSSTSKSLRLLFQTFILAAGCWLAIDQEITPGAMVAASIIMSRALAPIEQTISSWRLFVRFRVSFKRLSQLIDAFPQENTKIKHGKSKGFISADKLIVYPPNTKVPVLKGLSFQLKAGESLAILGRSGSGKSTLLRTLAGVWLPKSGAVTLDKIDLQQWNSDELGQQIGFLSQEVVFLSGSVAENISRFQEYEDHEVIDAAKFAGVHDQILKLPEGYDTKFENNASIISAGQKQLLGLARAVFRRPSLLLLDEPNAHLDKEGDLILANMLTRLKDEGITTILITHKTPVLAYVDNILEIKAGQTALFGPKEQLLKKPLPPTSAKTKADKIS